MLWGRQKVDLSQHRVLNYFVEFDLSVAIIPNGVTYLRWMIGNFTAEWVKARSQESLWRYERASGFLTVFDLVVNSTKVFRFGEQGDSVNDCDSDNESDG